MKKAAHSSGGSMSSTGGSTALDFDEEARALWERLNLDFDSRSKGLWNPVDPIWRHPTGNGMIYVGNQSAAENLAYLRSIGVTRVVNCTYGVSKIPDFHTGKLEYYNFPISHWNHFVNSSNASVLAFTQPMFDFIEEGVARGENVLVHCLAGAHRAGTTGCACLIHFADLDVRSAVFAAKKCRPIIDPIGQLPEFLIRLRKAYEVEHPLYGPRTARSNSSDSRGSKHAAGAGASSSTK